MTQSEGEAGWGWVGLELQKTPKTHPHLDPLPEGEEIMACKDAGKQSLFCISNFGIRVIWKQWKRSYTRAKNLMHRGMERDRALKSAGNGRGAWWNSGASHMNEAFPKKFFDGLGLASLLQQLKLIQCTT